MMTEVYRALLQLGCEWRVLSSYRIQCMWRPDADRSSLTGGFRTPPGGGRYGRDALSRGGGKSRDENYRVVAGLTLYKVQMNIYLLDFHKREGDQFTFMVSAPISRLEMSRWKVIKYVGVVRFVKMSADK